MFSSFGFSSFFGSFSSFFGSFIRGIVDRLNVRSDNQADQTPPNTNADTVWGGRGNDRMNGDNGDNALSGAAGNDKLFEKLCNLLKLDDVHKNPKFISNASRSQNIDELKKIIEDKLLEKDTNLWVQEMEKEKIPCGPIYNIKEAVENPQIESRNMIVKAYHKVIGDFKLAGNPIKMSTYKDEKTRGDIPDLDEHRDKIIKEFTS